MTKTYFKFDLPKEKGYSPDWCGSGYMGNIRNHKVLFYDEQEGYGVASCDTPKAELDKNLLPITEEEVISYAEGICRRGEMLVNLMGAISKLDAAEWKVSFDDEGQLVYTNPNTGKYNSMTLTINTPKVYIGNTLHDKWLPETVGIEDVPPVDVETGDEPEKPAEKRVVESKAKFCPICHKMLGFELFYSDNSYSMKMGTSTIQGIPAGQTINIPCTGHTAKITVSGARAVKPVKPEEIEPEAPVTRFCPICHELLILKGREKAKSEVEELIPENVTENYSNESYRVLTCPNGHRVKEVNNG